MRKFADKNTVEKITGLNYVWVLMPLGRCAFLQWHCDTFCLPFFLYFPCDSPVPSFSICSQYAFCFVCVLIFSIGASWTTRLPLPLAPQNCSAGLVKLTSKTHRVRIAVPGSVHVVSMTCEVGSVISYIPRAGKRLPTAYNFASLQAINTKSLVSFLHIKAKSMLWAAGCFCSNTECEFSG